MLYIQANFWSAGLLLTLSNQIRPIKIKVNPLLPCPEQSGKIKNSVFSVDVILGFPGGKQMLRVTFRSVCKCWRSRKWGCAVFGRKSVLGKIKSFCSSSRTKPGYVLRIPVGLQRFMLCVNESWLKLDPSNLWWFPLLLAFYYLQHPRCCRRERHHHPRLTQC